MTKLIRTYSIGCIATVRPDGAPAVSPKGTFLVIDPRTIAFAHIRSPGTVRNLQRRPEVEVAFVDVLTRQGCRVRGLASYMCRDQAESALQSQYKARWPDLFDLIQGFVMINVTEAELLSSPAYDVGGEAKQLAEHWLRDYGKQLGFTVIKRGR